MPLDINLFRTDRGGDPEVIRESQRRRFASVELVDEVIAKDSSWRECRSSIDFLNKERNRLQKEVTKAKKAGGDDPENVMKIKDIGVKIKETEVKLEELEKEVQKLLPKIGNIVGKDVPTSNDEEKDNEIVSVFGPTPTAGENCMHHHEVLHRIGGYEPERGVKVAGHRAYFLRDAGLLLNQALISYSVAFLKKRNYSVLQPPFFMSKDVMAGVAQLEQFDEELYKVTGEGIDEKYLIATSEQPMCAFHQGEWLTETELPLRYGGVSTCFRKEAGAHGKDTWGIFRVHQFEKVEQFVICEGDIEKSSAMQLEMSKTAEEFYQSLGLSYRVVNIVSGELNNAAIKKHDLEGWFPAYEEYRELVSCSNCTDYQSRAMEVRSGQRKMGQTEKKYVHMLNSTLCATTRTLSCILENCQTESGVKIPEVLVPYMGGITMLEYVKELPKNKREAKGATRGGYAVKPNAESILPTTPGTPSVDTPAGAAPSAVTPPIPPSTDGLSPEADSIARQIVAKGLEIRELKAGKVDKAELKPHIDKLLALKADYKMQTGKEYAPPSSATQASAPSTATAHSLPATGPVTLTATTTESPAAAAIAAKVAAKGLEIRELKASKVDKATLEPHIDELLSLKAQYAAETGGTKDPPPAAPKDKAGASGAKESKKDGKVKKAKAAGKGGKGGEGVGGTDQSNRGLTTGTLTVPKAAGPVVENGVPNLLKLAEHLLLFSYVGGWTPSCVDREVFDRLRGNAVERKEALTLPTVARWFAHLGSFTEGERGEWA